MDKSYIVMHPFIRDAIKTLGAYPHYSKYIVNIEDEEYIELNEALGLIEDLEWELNESQRRIKELEEEIMER